MKFFACENFFFNSSIFCNFGIQCGQVHWDLPFMNFQVDSPAESAVQPSGKKTNGVSIAYPHIDRLGSMRGVEISSSKSTRSPA